MAQSSLSKTERDKLYGEMLTLVTKKSKLVKDNPDYFTESVIEIALNETLLYIIDYIHRPDRYVLQNPTLQYIWANMCIDVLKANYAEDNPDSGVGGDVDVAGGITSIKMGNATVSYGSNDNSSSDSAAEKADELLKKYTRRLREYRVII